MPCLKISSKEHFYGPELYYFTSSCLISLTVSEHFFQYLPLIIGLNNFGDLDVTVMHMNKYDMWENFL